MSTDTAEIITEEIVAEHPEIDPETGRPIQYSLIGPQEGPQAQFVASNADICFYGGAMGGGKTAGLILAAAQHISIRKYAAVIFRRIERDITNPGGLWEESYKFYPFEGIDGTPSQSDLEWHFKSGAQIAFRGLQHEKDLLKWQGPQIPFIGFDEATQFSRSMFFYMLMRNRSTCGVNPHVRATCNPIPEDDPIGGWVHHMLQWWIDPESGFAIEERSGATRYLVIKSKELLWADSREESIDKYRKKHLPLDHPEQIKPLSVQFIQAKLSDNKILTEIDPEYIAKLEIQDEYLLERMLKGNWNSKLLSGTYFKVGKCEIVDAVPANLTYCRGWDLAATDGAGDFTAGPKLGLDANGTYYIVDLKRGQWETFYRDEMIKSTAQEDGYDCQQRFPEDPAAAGKSEAARLQRMLRGFYTTLDSTRGDKALRARGFQSQFNAGNVKMLRAPWNAYLRSELDSFETKGIPDDCCDSLATAFNGLSRPKPKAALGTSSDEQKEPDQTRQFNALISDYVREFWEQMIKDEEACPKWKGSFGSFKDDMGERPSEAHKIQRRQKLDLFSPDNCYWGIDGQEPPTKRHFAALGTS